MRRAAAVAVIVVPSGAFAQAGAFDAVAGGLRALQDRELLPRQEQLPPTVPQGNPPLPPKYGELPAPEAAASAADPRRFQIVRGGTVSRGDGQFVHIEGGTEFLYGGYRVFADVVDGNLRTRIFDLKGNVRVVGEDSVVVGDRVIVDFVGRTYHACDAESQLSPEQVGGNLTDYLYVRAGESFGGRRETRSLNSHLTTCNLPHPHYGIASDDLVVRPGRRAIFRKVRVQLFGKTIFTLPYLSIPLEDRRYNYLPEVGQSEEEGYYVKNRYGIPINDNNLFDARLDYMTKLGAGFGGDYQYRGRRYNGTTRFYTITGNNTLALNNQHRQDFGWGSIAFDNDFQRNNYVYAPGQTSLNTRALLTLPFLRGDTRITFQRNGTESSFGRNENRQVALADQRTIGNLRTTVDVNWSTSSSRFGNAETPSREQVDLRLRGQQEVGFATAALDYQRSIPVGETEGFFGGSDRTPVLSLTSDARRLIGGRFAEEWPFRTEFSIGEYADPSNQGRLGRAAFNVDVQRPDRSQNRFRFDTNAQFRQTLYSDDTAQYVLGLNNSVTYRLGRGTSANFRYSYLRPYGHAPMLLDRSGETNLATADVSYRPIRTALFGVQTGYDILRIQQSDIGWQQVGVRAEYAPVPNVLFRSLYTYDTFQQIWSNVRVDATWRPGDTTISLGARYDGFRKVWGNVNLFLDSVKIGRTRLSAIFAYSGYTERLEAQQYSIIYDLHCAEAVMSIIDSQTGYRPGREIQLFIRLKALPFDSLFGRGSRGQPIGVGTGRDF